MLKKKKMCFLLEKECTDPIVENKLHTIFQYILLLALETSSQKKLTFSQKRHVTPFFYFWQKRTTESKPNSAPILPTQPNLLHWTGGQWPCPRRVRQTDRQTSHFLSPLFLFMPSTFDPLFLSRTHVKKGGKVDKKRGTTETHSFGEITQRFPSNITSIFFFPWT